MSRDSIAEPRFVRGSSIKSEALNFRKHQGAISANQISRPEATVY